MHKIHDMKSILAKEYKSAITSGEAEDAAAAVEAAEEEEEQEPSAQNRNYKDHVKSENT